MQNLERRIHALEERASRSSDSMLVHLIAVREGESNEDAIKREGFSPEATDAFYICLTALRSAKGGAS